MEKFDKLRESYERYKRANLNDISYPTEIAGRFTVFK